MTIQDPDALQKALDGEKYYISQMVSPTPLVQPGFHSVINGICADGYWQFHSVTQTFHETKWYTLIVFDRTAKTVKKNTMGFHAY